MSGDKIDSLYKIADEFGSIAKNVNESSKRRKDHSEEIINQINKSLGIGDTLNQKLESVADANVVQRNQDNIVFNTCKILNSNMSKQLELVNELKLSGVVDGNIIDELTGSIDELISSIREAINNVQEIIENDNNIILMDSLIMTRKKYQQDSISTLKKLARISLEDAEKAIDGSSSNLQRGLDMVEKFKSVDSLVKDNKVDDLKNLADDANRGWNIAKNVNKSSNSQLEFAEKVKEFTDQFHEDSTTIKEMVVEKHHMFEQNLQIVTVLTVVLSLKFKKYLEINDTVQKIEFNDKIRNIMNNLSIFIDIACKDITDVTKLNYDMTDASHLNNEVETKTVDLTKEELECFEKIQSEVEKMTEATRYPIEGSGKNIENGQVMEKLLNEVIAEM
jgi:hypothetical protein